MDLCGHATLATAYCLKEHLNYNSDLVKFDSMSGELIVKYDKDYLLEGLGCFIIPPI